MKIFKTREIQLMSFSIMPLGSADRDKIMKNFAIYVRKVADLEYLNKTEVSGFIMPFIIITIIYMLLLNFFQTEVDQYKIAANSIGHSYQRIFTRCCDAQLRMVHIQDAYIIAHHQLLNFVRFCELIIPLSVNLLVITLKTGEDARKNLPDFDELARFDETCYDDIIV